MSRTKKVPLDVLKEKAKPGSKMVDEKVADGFAGRDYLSDQQLSDELLAYEERLAVLLDQRAAMNSKIEQVQGFIADIEQEFKMRGSPPKVAVSPPGWEGTVKKMKKHKDVDNPWALAWWMKGKGYESHKKDSMFKSLNEYRKQAEGTHVRDTMQVLDEMERLVDRLGGPLPPPHGSGQQHKFVEPWESAKFSLSNAISDLRELTNKGAMGVDDEYDAETDSYRPSKQSMFQSLNQYRKQAGDLVYSTSQILRDMDHNATMLTSVEVAPEIQEEWEQGMQALHGAISGLRATLNSGEVGDVRL
jgi:hypothetical protein